MNYLDAVEHCKNLVRVRNTAKHEIAKISFKFCYSQHGGKQPKIRYSLPRFAKDIGICTKTLYRWRREFELVINKLKLPKGEKVANRAMEILLKETNKDTPAKEVKEIYKGIKVKTDSPDDSYLLEMCKRIGNYSFAINHRFVLKEMDRADLETMRDYGQEIADGINDFLKGKEKSSSKIRSSALSEHAKLNYL